MTLIEPVIRLGGILLKPLHLAEPLRAGVMYDLLTTGQATYLQIGEEDG